jgi:thermitase
METLVRFPLMLSLLLLAIAAPAAEAATDETRIIVGRDPGLTAVERAGIRDDAGVELLRTLRVSDTEVVTAPRADAAAALRELRADPDVRWAVRDRIRRVAADPAVPYQWALDNTGNNLAGYQSYGAPLGQPDADMDTPEAWPTSAGALAGGGRVRVGVVDTRIDTTHEDLAGQVAGTVNFVSPASETATCGDAATDASAHGTHVAGIVAAVRDNGVGIAGVAPGAEVLGLRAMNDQGCGWDSEIIAAFDYAGDHHVPVVNASLGGVGDGTAFTDVMARHPGTLFIVSAGNSGESNDVPATAAYPCAAAPVVDNVVCVGASTPSDTAASFSNFGRRSVDLFAPGEWILSTVPGDGDGDGHGDGYAFMDGTSQASPQVAGEAALVLGAVPQLTMSQLRSILLRTAEYRTDLAAKSATGGRANAAAAVASAAHPPASDGDADGIADANDRCPAVSAPGTATGCPPAIADRDGDGVADAADRCPTQPGAGGCPAPAAPADRDGDGRVNALDACPTEAAATVDGCPVPALRSLKVSVVKRKRRATAIVRVDRRATVAFRLERRVCKTPRRTRCGWRTVATRAAVSKHDRARFVRRLARGSYRLTVRLSSSAGHTGPRRKAFSVR